MSTASQNSSAPRLPRGLRNNNPLNIRHGNKWKGLAPLQNDTRFDQFISMEYGVRAGFRILHTYITKHQCNTLRKIIHRFAPVSENNTDTYIRMISHKTGIAPDTIISISDRNSLISIVDAMIWCECGCHIDDNIITKGYQLAFPHEA